jgi:taurine dioxygenase
MERFELDAIERVVTRPRGTYASIEVAPLTPVIGAEVAGLDLSQEPTPAQLTDVKQAFLDHHVLVFRDQKLTVDQHKAFARNFGELRTFADEDGDPSIVEVKTTRTSSFIAGEDWHTDGSADAEPSLGSLLYITETPDGGSGGDTLFANMHLAYEILSPSFKAMLEPLTAVHDGLIPWQGYAPPDGYVVPKNEHPVIVRHPETGRKLLYVNGGYVSHIVGLAARESRAVLDLLLGLIAREPMLHCRVRWTPNTVVFWDNRCTQHHAIWDYYPYSRYGQRVSVNGTRPRA